VVERLDPTVPRRGAASASLRQNAALVVVLALAGAASWAFQLRGPLEVDASPLAALPHQVLSWSGRDVPMEGSVEQILRADQHVQRSYYDSAGGLVWMYVGYYGTARGGRSEHTPWVCYPTAGWDVLHEHSRRVAAGPGSEIQEILVQRGNERRLVHFWYRTTRSDHVVGELAHAWDRFLGRLTLGRADGAFVRLSTPLRGESPESGRARLLSFRRALDVQLAAHWPVETGASQDG
jgi:EpsI family protein